MRLFGSERIAVMMDRMGLQEGEVIQASMMSKAIERAQKKVEENHYGVRKRLLEYDDVMNSQRTVIYTQRKHALYGERIEIDLNNIMYDFADDFVENNHGADFEDFSLELIRQIGVQPSFDNNFYESAKKQEIADKIVEDIRTAIDRRAHNVATLAMPIVERIYKDKGAMFETIRIPITNGKLGYNVQVNMKKCCESNGADIYKMFSKLVMLTTIDDNWREHLREMDESRHSVQNASYEQKDPLLIYKLESFNLFSKMLLKINREVLSILTKGYLPVRGASADGESAAMQQQRERQRVDVNKLHASRMAAAAQAGQGEKSKPMPVKVEKKVGRNDPCPCGSGKKYKQCHGKNVAE
jgi:preprotein translocase subunit SecA